MPVVAIVLVDMDRSCPARGFSVTSCILTMEETMCSCNASHADSTIDLTSEQQTFVCSISGSLISTSSAESSVKTMSASYEKLTDAGTARDTSGSMTMVSVILWAEKLAGRSAGSSEKKSWR